MGRNQKKKEPNFLELNDEYHILYYSLIKESKFWNNSGQYWLGHELKKKALNILNGNIDGINIPVPSERLFYDKIRGTIGDQ